jgi:branched-chain amino acid transport system ATP-binding protein
VRDELTQQLLALRAQQARMMSSASTSLLEVEELGVRYGALVALDAVDWHVGSGEIVGIIGPNGAGKSSCYDAVTNLTSRRAAQARGTRPEARLPAERILP